MTTSVMTSTAMPPSSPTQPRPVGRLKAHRAFVGDEVGEQGAADPLDDAFKYTPPPGKCTSVRGSTTARGDQRHRHRDRHPTGGRPAYLRTLLPRPQRRRHG